MIIIMTTGDTLDRNRRRDGSSTASVRCTMIDVMSEAIREGAPDHTMIMIGKKDMGVV